ncbi:hypothetical protein BH09MYX1_BH09MYX1_12750 [soil metagenome]
MSFTVFEILCVVVVVGKIAAMARTKPVRALLIDYAALAVAAWIGEETCVALYRFYAYADGWHLRLDRVPLLVPLIWPLVVLSARDVAAIVAPRGSPIVRALVAGAIVAFDASLVEVVAVRAKLWSWSEPGHLGVPLIGILGWGHFAAGALAPKRRAWTLVTGPLVAHALIQLSWWGLFRFALRGDLGAFGFVIVALGASVFAVFAIRARRAGHLMTPAVWSPRVLAALLFVGLLVWTAPRDVGLWLHTALVAIPYLVITSAHGWHKSAREI